MNEIKFFVPMVLPTVTHQEKKIGISSKSGKPYVYEPAALKDARAKLEAYLAKYAPKTKLEGALRLTVKWCFDRGKSAHMHGEYKTTKPDTDNMIKLLKDVMTSLGYWQDDAQVASEINEKFWSSKPGLFVQVDMLDVSLINMKERA